MTGILALAVRAALAFAGGAGIALFGAPRVTSPILWAVLIILGPATVALLISSPSLAWRTYIISGLAASLGLATTLTVGRVNDVDVPVAVFVPILFMISMVAALVGLLLGAVVVALRHDLAGSP